MINSQMQKTHFTIKITNDKNYGRAEAFWEDN